MVTMIEAKRSIYAEEIFKLAEEKENRVFYNSSAEHATIVHQALMKTAEQYVYIFSSGMCTEISNNNDYCNAARNFLVGDKSRKIKILLTDYSEDFCQMPIAKMLFEYPIQVTVKKYPGNIYYKNSPAHFTVTDDRAFRLETDIKNHMAFGNFNSPTQAIALKSIFEKAFESPLASSISIF